MREIIFRGKRTNDGEWIEGSLCTTIPSDENFYTISYFDFEGYYIEEKVIPETVEQYTGLTDKNGKKIFEGDIVTMPAYAGGRHKAVVYFKNGKFAVDGSNYHFKDIAPKRMEVIGNIHDNRELLK